MESQCRNQEIIRVWLDYVSKEPRRWGSRSILWWTGDLSISQHAVHAGSDAHSQMTVPGQLTSVSVTCVPACFKMLTICECSALSTPTPLMATRRSPQRMRPSRNAGLPGMMLRTTDGRSAVRARRPEEPCCCPSVESSAAPIPPASEKPKLTVGAGRSSCSSCGNWQNLK